MPRSACSGWRPKPRRLRSWSTAKPRICGRRSSTASASPRASRRHWVPRSAMISMHRSIQPRRCAGPSVGVVAGDPSLPAGVEALAEHVMAPPELARRLAQIGVVSRERGAQLASQLKTGQRLVSPEGDLWRWDGFVAAAHAPTGAARQASPSARAWVETEIEQAQARIDAASDASGTGDRRRRADGRLRRRDRRPRSPAQHPHARPTPRASNTLPPSARSTATRHAAPHWMSAASTARRRPHRGPRRVRERQCGASAICRQASRTKEARRRSRRHGRPSPPRSPGPRRSAGAGPRSRTRRPPRAGHSRRAQRMAEPQGKRRVADRHRRDPHRRSEDRARRT